jgi:hypothetical protein
VPRGQRDGFWLTKVLGFQILLYGILKENTQLPNFALMDPQRKYFGFQILLYEILRESTLLPNFALLDPQRKYFGFQILLYGILRESTLLPNFVLWDPQRKYLLPNFALWYSQTPKSNQKSSFMQKRLAKVNLPNYITAIYLLIGRFTYSHYQTIAETVKILTFSISWIPVTVSFF